MVSIDVNGLVSNYQLLKLTSYICPSRNHDCCISNIQKSLPHRNKLVATWIKLLELNQVETNQTILLIC